MRVAVASDHAGYSYKNKIIAFLEDRGITAIDFGTDSDAPVDYPDFVKPAAQAVADGKAELGIVVGGSGNGEAITANRFLGIRCALCWNEWSAEHAKKHNDANMIAIGERTVPLDLALRIVSVWLDNNFEGGRHIPRIDKIDR